jgi:ribose-phosphate pyrophosphokinase
MKIFSGTSNLSLGQSVATGLHVALADVEITRFIDSECRVFVKEAVAGEDVFVIQSLSEVADQHLVELCLLGSALKNLNAKSLTAVIPWLGYSKQDKAFRVGEAISSQLVAKFIEAAGFDRVIACELHSETVVPYFQIPMTELSTHELLAQTLKSKGKWQGAVVASPDKGGKSRSERFAKTVGLSIVYLDKSRSVTTGEVTVSNVTGGAVTGKTVIIFDDIINTGATAVKTSEFLRSHGAKEIYFLATHAVLAGDAATSLEQSAISEVIVTDSIAIPEAKRFKKLSVVSVSSLIAGAISTSIR